MAKAHVEPPEGWGARRILEGRLIDLGYRTQLVGAGEVWRIELR